MPSVIAKNTIHRPGKTQGVQDVIKPGESFECSDKEAEELLALNAVSVIEKAPAPAKSAPKKSSKKPAANAADADAGDDDLAGLEL